MAFASLKKAETETLRILMIQRGLTTAALGEKCGMARSTMSNQISKNFPSRRLRLLVESALNLPIWSNPAAFDARQQLSQKCGFDPFTAALPKLRQLATALKLRGRSRDLHKAALIALMQAHFASTENTNTNTPTSQ